ncbi:MAG: hypothetical protein AABZ31_10690 [Bdellovibrionota bacterium]
MEKISRILPSSPRFTSDMRNSGVARSGTPSFGRPVGVSALAKPAFDGMAKASDELKEFQEMRTPALKSVDPKAQIVERMANDFFVKRAAAPTIEENQEFDQIVESFHDEESDLNPMTAKIREGIDDDMPVIGGNLNIIA